MKTITFDSVNFTSRAKVGDSKFNARDQEYVAFEKNKLHMKISEIINHNPQKINFQYSKACTIMLVRLFGDVLVEQMRLYSTNLKNTLSNGQ